MLPNRDSESCALAFASTPKPFNQFIKPFGTFPAGKEYGDENDQSQHDQLGLRQDADQVHDVGNDADEETAYNGADRIAGPAEERRPSDYRGSDGIELISLGEQRAALLKLGGRMSPARPENSPDMT